MGIYQFLCGNLLNIIWLCQLIPWLSLRGSWCWWLVWFSWGSGAKVDRRISGFASENAFGGCHPKSRHCRTGTRAHLGRWERPQAPQSSRLALRCLKLSMVSQSNFFWPSCRNCFMAVRGYSCWPRCEWWTASAQRTQQQRGAENLGFQDLHGLHWSPKFVAARVCWSLLESWLTESKEHEVVIWKAILGRSGCQAMPG